MHRELVFSHAEADTMLLSAYIEFCRNGTLRPVVIDTEDTDVYVQAAYVSQRVDGDLFLRRKGSYVNYRTMPPENIANIIIAAHTLTGSDHTSCFYGHVKKSLMKRLFSDPEACELLLHVGESLDLGSHAKHDMRAFVLTETFGGDVGKTCGQV